MEPEPIRFSRTGGSKALGCIAYLFLAPALGITLGILAGGLLGALASLLGASEDAALAVGLTAGYLALVFSIVFAIRDFRRRALTEILFYPDRLEIGTSKTHTPIPFGEIRSLRLKISGSEYIPVLTTEAGPRYVFPAGIAPFSAVQPAIMDLLLPHLLQKIENTLVTGQSISFREGVFISWGRIAYGFTLILMSFLMMASIRFIVSGLRAFRFGHHLIRQGWRSRRGGFEISTDGLAPAGTLLARPIPWNEVILHALDDDGIVLGSVEGHTASASFGVENFLPLALWIRGKADLRTGALQRKEA